MNKIKNLVNSYRKLITVALSVFVLLIIISAVGHHVFYKWLHEDGPFAPYMSKVHEVEHSISGGNKEHSNHLKEHSDHHEH